jgi:glycogen operon protein
MRNMLSTLLLSRGTPMLLAGDEFARTQHRNNNAYFQDNAISWIDWDGIGDDERELAEFTRKLIALRGALPMLRRGLFLTAAFDEELGVKDVTWLTPAGDEMAQAHWDEAQARCLGILLDGRAQESGIRRLGTDATLLLITNAHHDVVEFTLPEAMGGTQWVCLLDTNHGEADEPAEFDFGYTYEVTAHSLLLFILRPTRTKGRRTATERSFDHVIQATEDASHRQLAFPVPAGGSP